MLKIKINRQQNQYSTSNNLFRPVSITMEGTLTCSKNTNFSPLTRLSRSKNSWTWPLPWFLPTLRASATPLAAPAELPWRCRWLSWRSCRSSASASWPRWRSAWTCSWPERWACPWLSWWCRCLSISRAEPVRFIYICWNLVIYKNKLLIEFL